MAKRQQTFKRAARKRKAKQLAKRAADRRKAATEAEQPTAQDAREPQTDQG